MELSVSAIWKRRALSYRLATLAPRCRPSRCRLLAVVALGTHSETTARDSIASALSRRANQVWHQRLLVRRVVARLSSLRRAKPDVPNHSLVTRAGARSLA